MECGRSNCSMGIWTICVDTCRSEPILKTYGVMLAHMCIPIGVMCDPSTYSSLGIGRDSLWPLRMVPWGKCIPHPRFCTFTFFG